MNEKLVIIICELLLGIGIFTGIAVVISAAWYDFRAVTRRKYRDRLARAIRQPRQPQIVVLVYAHNNSATITACLRSIARSRYKNYQIIVVDNVSRDSTKQRVRQFQKKHPKTSLQLYAKRRATGHLSALQAGYKKAGPNDLVLTLDATEVIQPMLLKLAATQFIINDSLGVLRLHRTIDTNSSFSALIRQFSLLSQNLLHKAVPALSIHPHQLGRNGMMFRSVYFKQKQSSTKLTTHYASDLTVNRSEQSIHPLPTTITWLPKQLSARIVVTLVLLLIPAMITYFFYTAATLQSNILLTLSWLAVTLWLVVAVLSDETQSFTQKIGLCFCIPVMYVVFYVQSCVALLSISWYAVSYTGKVSPRFLRLLPIKPVSRAGAVR